MGTPPSTPHSYIGISQVYSIRCNIEISKVGYPGLWMGMGVGGGILQNACEVLLLRKGGGGGEAETFPPAKVGHEKFCGSFYTVALLNGGWVVGAQNVSTLLKGGQKVSTL